MKGRKKDIHRGEALKAAVSESGLKISELVRRAGYSRSAYYNHVEDPNLAYHILAHYGKTIKHDFSAEFPDMLTQMVEEPEEPYGEPKTLGDAIRQRDQWKEKYYQLLEKHQKLLEERMK